jgi:hypothetical protein
VNEQVQPAAGRRVMSTGFAITLNRRRNRPAGYDGEAPPLTGRGFHQDQPPATGDRRVYQDQPPA